jgi:hypothetical protein
MEILKVFLKTFNSVSRLEMNEHSSAKSTFWIVNMDA